MQILFVDESGTPPPPEKMATTPLFVLGGIVVPEDFWSKLAADLKRLKLTTRHSLAIPKLLEVGDDGGVAPRGLCLLLAERGGQAASYGMGAVMRHSGELPPRRFAGRHLRSDGRASP